MDSKPAILMLWCLTTLLASSGCIKEASWEWHDVGRNDVHGELIAELPCIPACTERECGDDGCGTVCGTCGCGETCQDGSCVFRACDDRECGDDGCGGSCGACDGPNSACVDGSCQCIPDCTGRESGDFDGCGGCCGACCIDGTCSSEAGETCASCPEDCDCCPNGVCDGWEGDVPIPGVDYLETHYSCPQDCSIPCVCGDGYCIGSCGEGVDSCEPDCFTLADGACGPSENFQNSPLDCCGICGDGICQNYPGCNEGETSPGQWLCPEDCADFPCGNAECEEGEDPVNCPQDCEKWVCGNGVCEPTDALGCLDCQTLGDCGDCVCQKPQEDAISCPQDCGLCGDGYCSPCAYPVLPETAENCFADCAICGDGVCGPGEGPGSCPEDCCGFCGDGLCMVGELVSCTEDSDCPADCDGFDCGDGDCSPSESAFTCVTDCGKGTCGNYVCEAADPPNPGGEPGGMGETVDSCPEDCLAWPMCGDYLCQMPHETALDCPLDCGFCGDGYCSGSPLLGNESLNCPQDCEQERR